MTIEEKAKAYDKVLESIKELYSKGSRVVVSKEEFETIFPELTDSEDEKVKKIITLCLEECVHSDIIRDYEKDDALAWLEKQGKTINN